MYENKSQRLAPRKVLYKRTLRHLLLGCLIILVCLFIGIVGYHFTAGAQWIDAFHNASMILSGMGPVVEIRTPGGKWFSSLYALFSGVVFITTVGIILAPAVHRFFHKLHLEVK